MKAWEMECTWGKSQSLWRVDGVNCVIRRVLSESSLTNAIITQRSLAATHRADVLPLRWCLRNCFLHNSLLKMSVDPVIMTPWPIIQIDRSCRSIIRWEACLHLQINSW